MTTHRRYFSGGKFGDAHAKIGRLFYVLDGCIIVAGQRNVALLAQGHNFFTEKVAVFLSIGFLLNDERIHLLIA